MFTNVELKNQISKNDVTKAAEKDAVEDHLLDDFSFGSEDEFEDDLAEEARITEVDRTSSIVSDRRWSIVGGQR